MASAKLYARGFAAPDPQQFWTHAMIVLALTAFVGLALVTFFIVLFVCYAAGGAGVDHEALLPLEDEIASIVVHHQPQTSHRP